MTKIKVSTKNSSRGESLVSTQHGLNSAQVKRAIPVSTWSVTFPIRLIT